LQAGVDISVIVLWLGRESLVITHHYVEADLSVKERALSQGHPVALADSAQQSDQRTAAASLAAKYLSLKNKVGLPGAYGRVASFRVKRSLESSQQFSTAKWVHKGCYWPGVRIL